MTLKDYLQFLNRYYRVILAVTAVCVALGLAVSFLSVPRYKASTTLAVRREAAETNPNYFTYEGYYAQQTAQEYADTVVGFLESYDTALHTLVLAGLPSGTEQVKILSSRIKAEKTAPNLVALTLDWEDASTSATLVNSLVNATKQSSQRLNEKGDKAIHVDPLVDDPIVEELKPRFILNSAVFGLLGLLLSAVSLSFYLYLTEE